MIEVRKTDGFDRWLRKLADRQAKVHIIKRINRVELGNLGDVKPARNGVSELRIDYGPGYRLYFVQYDALILLVGGTKGTQDGDIERAVQLARELKLAKGD